MEPEDSLLLHKNSPLDSKGSLHMNTVHTPKRVYI
jgi:hypothetical protein